MTELESTQYDFIVCGAGTSGCVVARRLAETSASVLLLEAGGNVDIPEVLDARRWLENLGSERDWAFPSEPNPHLHGRSIPLSIGKILGGGSSINGMLWAHGHRSDWDFFAETSGFEVWNYENTKELFERLEACDWDVSGTERGTDGLLYVSKFPDTHASAETLDAIRDAGLPTFNDFNGPLWESTGGSAVYELRSKGAERQLIYKDYIESQLNELNLTVRTKALVHKIEFEGDRARAVVFETAGVLHRVEANCEIILSLGAVNTPAVLLRSGVGPQEELHRLDVPVQQPLSGVGSNLMDHVLVPGFVRERTAPDAAGAPPSMIGMFGTSREAGVSPDFTCIQVDALQVDPTLADKVQMDHPTTFVPAVVQPLSRGQVSLRSTSPSDAPIVKLNYLSRVEDLSSILAAIELSREVGKKLVSRSQVSEELLTRTLTGDALKEFIRKHAMSFSHPSGTAAMGTDKMAVVSGDLRVYGTSALRVADACIMPRITTSPTMAPCVVIGERAAEFIKNDWKL